MKSQGGHFNKIIINRILATFLLMFVAIGVTRIMGIPNPEILLLIILVMITSIFGTESGIVSIVMLVLYVMFFYSAEHSFLVYNSNTELSKVIVTFLCSLVCLLFSVLVIHKRLAKRLSKK